MNKELAEKIKGIRDKQNTILAENMPKFERGIMEAAVERESELWKDLKGIFEKHKISVSVSTKIISENQVPKDGSGADRPILICPGLQVNIEYLVTSIDKEGKSGNFPSDVISEIQKLNEELAELLDEEKKHKELKDEVKNFHKNNSNLK